MTRPAPSKLPGAVSLAIGALALIAFAAAGAARSAPAGEASVHDSNPKSAAATAELDETHDPPASEDEFPVPPPPFTEGYFPCTECHADMETNRERRELTEMHEDIELNHGPRDRWCFDCHDPDNRDVLRLAGGREVPFTESYRLCGQCHGEKLRDWKVGVHGKRTGEWNGKRQYLLCAHCHNPHTPHFAPIEPLSAPARPGDIR
ncbi:hypothetical protein K8I61_10170 [bacterium]|nr:hypothetical protein [bacterium]